MEHVTEHERREPAADEPSVRPDFAAEARQLPSVRVEPAEREAVFSLRDLAVLYSGSKAVEGVEFDLYRNEITAFIVRGALGLKPVVLAGGLTLGLLVLPVVIIAAREAIRAVPPSIREGSLALGATQWQTIRRQVLPAAVPGIATGVILALSRAIGETAPLIVVGAATFVAFNPSGVTSPFTALPIQIFNWISQPQTDFKLKAAAAILVLLAILLAMNSAAIYLRNRFEKKW